MSPFKACWFQRWDRQQIWGSDKPEGSQVTLKKTTILVLAVTLHNNNESGARLFFAPDEYKRMSQLSCFLFHF